VGKDTVGEAKGYFGLEGLYDLELRGRSGVVSQEKDASGKPILIGEYHELEAVNGRSLVLNLDRAVQKIVEDYLNKGLAKYKASKGEVIVMDPKSGKIIAMAAFPNYDPANYEEFDKNLFRNPCIAETYEPGSTFKVLVMAAAIDSGVVKPDTVCDICSGPVRIGSYTIGTWNDQYHPGIDMKGVIERSDNVGMVFVSQKLGKEKLLDYLTKFGIGKKTGIDLEEEQSPELRNSENWKDIDVATAAFGQGVAVTAMQMVRSVAAIANHGLLPTPQVVNRVIGESEIPLSINIPNRVISEKTAAAMTKIMVNAVDKGEAKWAKPKGYNIAGKTGTAQVPVSGHYDDEKTIASFVGFAPAENPLFVMLVKLREPQTSPWGSETAAPLWFSIAKELFLYYGVQPDR
jgi:cell division protein FtsI/penicillin-binding protein 2